MKEKNNYIISKNYNFWWRDKTKGIKIRNNNLPEFVDELMNLYNLKNAKEFKNKSDNIFVDIKYCIRLERGTFLIDIKGSLKKVYCEFMDIVLY